MSRNQRIKDVLLGYRSLTKKDCCRWKESLNHSIDDLEVGDVVMLNKKKYRILNIYEYNLDFSRNKFKYHSAVENA